MIIGLTGLKSSGKSTIADYLVSEHGFTLVSFAALLKESVAALFGITVEQIEEWKNDAACTITLTLPNGMKQTQSLRSFLQRYGTEAHREVFGMDFWIEQATKSWDTAADLVCADCRFDNEAKALVELGGWIALVTRPGMDVGDTHASEAGLSDHLIDGELMNYGTVLQLDYAVDSMLMDLRREEKLA